jgi:hypothetical protein
MSAITLILSDHFTDLPELSGGKSRCRGNSETPRLGVFAAHSFDRVCNCREANMVKPNQGQARASIDQAEGVAVTIAGDTKADAFCACAQTN